ncbi:MAG: aldo/keto reductase [Flavobacteriales bacterium]|nr:aldo/keto reductase [Flavobacteriales bacterium]
MQKNKLGKTNLLVSEISFGASALGGVYNDVDEDACIETVQVAINVGINLIDVAPAYGGTKAETVLGKALKDIPRDMYYISTKAGKYTDPDNYSNNEFNYTEKKIREGLEESMKRLGVDYLDIVHLHDFDYENGAHCEAAFSTGFGTLLKLKEEGVIGAIGAGIYDMELWHRVIAEAPVDAILLHNHYSLLDTLALELIDACNEKEIGIINASPFASSLLTPGPAAHWHPATTEERALLEKAAQYCNDRDFSITDLAIQFSTQQNHFPTTLFSTDTSDTFMKNMLAYRKDLDYDHVKAVQTILAPIINKQWAY